MRRRLKLQVKIKEFDVIMSDMLSRVPDDIDKTQGSIIWDALAPAAIELNAMYFFAQDILNLSFVRTSQGAYLTELAFQFGVDRLQATKAVRAAEFNITMAIGTRFSVADSEINFVVIEKRDNDYLLECETEGSAGNFVQGTLIPIEYVNGLVPSEIDEVVIIGEDEETDDSLRVRTVAHITRPEQDGNIDQYLKWAHEFVGIGNATVVPLWNGPNTVKVVITNSDGNTATPELVNKFQDYLDPGVEGRGQGKAPIGAFVTVASATPQKINVTMKITLNGAYILENAKTKIQALLIKYMSTATKQRAFKKYEAASLIDALAEVDYIVSFNGNDIVMLDDSSIFALGDLAVTL